MKKPIESWILLIEYLCMSVAWFMVAFTQWGLVSASLSTIPLFVCLILMATNASVWFIYAGLLTLPYMATVITQIVLVSPGRIYAIACLAFGLSFLALLGVNSRKLKAMRR